MISYPLDSSEDAKPQKRGFLGI